MARYHYREGVTLDKKKKRWFLILISLIVIAAALYVTIVFLAPQFVTVPFTNLTADATAKKIEHSKAGQYGDRLFLPQINVDVAIASGGDSSLLAQGAWQRNAGLGNPQKGGNFALSAYKFTLDTTPQWTRAKSPFYNLDKLSAGDDMTVDYKGARYIYKIDKKYNIRASDTSVEQKSNDARLTLYATDARGSAVTGTIIEAKLLNPPNKEQATSFGNVLGTSSSQ